MKDGRDVFGGDIKNGGGLGYDYTDTCCLNQRPNTLTVCRHRGLINKEAVWACMKHISFEIISW